MRIAIDGPAGVGKSTIGERLARRLNALYVDTGALYRALTLLALRERIAPDDATALTDLAHRMRITIVPPTVADGRQYTVLLDGEDVTPELRTPAVDANVSRMSSHSDVRETLISRMREMAGATSVVMVGRDIGTVVLPDAELKIYLTTSIEERAKRRHGDLVAKYGAASPALDDVRREIAQRDALDMPNMRIAPDAVTLNNDHLQADEVVELILKLLDERARQHRVDNGRSGAMAAQQDEYGRVSPFWYGLMRILVTLVQPFIVRLHVEGVEHIPSKGPVIIAINHVAWIDTVFAALRCPRPFQYMAKIELFHVPVVGFLIRKTGSFPVHRGESDREALRTAERVLAEDKLLVIFPEGHRTRGGPLLPGRPGIALIAMRTGAPIVAVGISGTERVFKGFNYGPFAPRVTIRYSEPFYVTAPDGKRSRERLVHATEDIMRRIAALVPPEQRGQYGETSPTIPITGAAPADSAAPTAGAASETTPA